MKNILSLILFIGIVINTNAQKIDENLYKSVVKNDFKKTEKLIKKGGNVNYIKQSEPWMKVNLLCTAVNNNNLKIAKLLLENQADVNWKDGFKTSAILYAASNGNLEMIKLLLEYGANINDNDGNKNTVLTAAKESKNKDVIEFVEKKLKETN
ncbi:ankyrin repeat domain-containing protein [Aureivirga sp. CE67]|uniref:ankyrin repeat domain-containing protein n=1 Tax=Aureivirga sp. CE67 TaxID=1788983 RepID=UPI0018CA1E8E|nr:ankyrin repeat domain-containing protein [Aureivirga sp. CE67]